MLQDVALMSADPFSIENIKSARKTLEKFDTGNAEGDIEVVFCSCCYVILMATHTMSARGMMKVHADSQEHKRAVAGIK